MYKYFGFDDYENPNVQMQLTAGLALGREYSHVVLESGNANANWLLNFDGFGRIGGNSARLLALPLSVS